MAIPEKITYFRASNGARWVADSSNKNQMQRGRDLANDERKITVTEEELDNKVNTIKITGSSAYDRNYWGRMTVNFMIGDFSFQTGSDNAMDILMNSTTNDGVVTNCPMLWICGNTFCHLVRENSSYHNLELAATVKTKIRPLPASLIRPGYVYKTERGTEYLYLGYGSYESKIEEKTYSPSWTPIITKKIVKHEGHCWKWWYSGYTKDNLSENMRNREYELIRFDVLKSNKKVVSEDRFIDFTLYDILNIGKLYYPNAHEIKTMRIG